MQGRVAAGYRAPVRVTLGLVGAVIVLLVALIAVRRGFRRPATSQQALPGEAVVGLPSRHPHVTTRSLSGLPRALTGPGAAGWGTGELKSFTRDESIEFLRDRGVDRKAAKDLAEALGGFPLALDLAAGYIEVADVKPHDYLVRVLTQMSRIRRGALPALWSLTATYLRSRTPTTFEALEMWAVLGTEPIPLAVFGADADADLASRLGLVIDGGDYVIVHPLVQELVRSGPDTRRRYAVLRAAALMRAYLAGATDSEWRALLPHVYAITARPELGGDRTASWLLHHAEFLSPP